MAPPPSPALAANSGVTRIFPEPHVRSWHLCDVRRECLDFRFWRTSRRVADLTADLAGRTEFDPMRSLDDQSCAAYLLLNP
jgi:hypothetical protein